MRIYSIVIAIYILLSSTISAAAVPAGASIGGWKLVDTVRDGIYSIYTATKTTVVDGVSITRTATARYAPKALSVAKYAGRGGVGVAVYLFESTILDGIDYLIDSSGRLSYKQVGASVSTGDPNNSPPWAKLLWSYNGYHTSPGDAMNAACDTNGAWPKLKCTIVDVDGTVATVSQYYEFESGSTTPPSRWYIYAIPNPNYDENEQAPTTPVVVAPSKVGQSIIDIAGSNESSDQKKAATDLIHTVADNAWVEGGEVAAEIEQALEDDAKLGAPTAEPGDPTIPATGTGVGSGSSVSEGTGTSEGSGSTTASEFELPKFCDWVPVVCEASVGAIKYFTEFSSLFYYDEELYEDMGTVNTAATSSDQSRLNSDLSSFKGSLGLSNSSCPSSFNIVIPKFTTINIDLSYWCTLMGITKTLLHLGVLFVSARIISNSVRDI